VESAVPKHVPLVNIANILTMSRFVLVPVFLTFLLMGDGHEVGWRWAATTTFVVASITDQVDGYLARSRGLVTNFGKIADPIADKALVLAALIGLNVLHDLAWWVTIVIAVREVGVTILRFVVLKYGVIAANRGGKTKTLTQIFAIVGYLLPLPSVLHLVAVGIMLLAVVLTVATGVDYLVAGWRLWKSAHE
jgi:CDP-diacylglycerol--glycerol-3-phosphate 3-phosphatidyltransferase